MTYADTLSTLSNGNAQAVLALCVLILAGVIVYQNRKLDSKDTIIQGLQDARLQDFKDREDKLVAPMELMGRNTQFIYDKMLNGK